MSNPPRNRPVVCESTPDGRRMSTAAASCTGRPRPRKSVQPTDDALEDAILTELADLVVGEAGVADGPCGQQVVVGASEVHRSPEAFRDRHAPSLSSPSDNERLGVVGSPRRWPQARSADTVTSETRGGSARTAATSPRPGTIVSGRAGGGESEGQVRARPRPRPAAGHDRLRRRPPPAAAGVERGVVTPPPPCRFGPTTARP